MMRRKFSRYAVTVVITLLVAGLLAAGAASANPVLSNLLLVPDPTPALLLGAGLAGLAFQGRRQYHQP